MVFKGFVSIGVEQAERAASRSRDSETDAKPLASIVSPLVVRKSQERQFPKERDKSNTKSTQKQDLVRANGLIHDNSGITSRGRAMKAGKTTFREQIPYEVLTALNDWIKTREAAITAEAQRTEAALRQERDEALHTVERLQDQVQELARLYREERERVDALNESHRLYVASRDSLQKAEDIGNPPPTGGFAPSK